MTAEPNNRFVFVSWSWHLLCRVCCELKPGLRLLFVLATEHTLLRKFLNIWCQILFAGDLDDDALLSFYTIKAGNFNCPRGLQLPARLSNYQCTFT